MFTTLRNAFKIPDLRKKIIYTFLMLFVIRLGAAIPVPGVNTEFLKNFLNTNKDLMGMFDAITGGSFFKVTIFAMGIMPYITASIIMNLLTIAIPKLEEMQKEGEDGRKRIMKYTRYVTVALSFVQSTTMAIGFKGLLLEYNVFSVITVILALTSGTAFLMWIGERITENGIGNGISIIIFVNILSRMPMDINTLYKQVIQGEGIVKAIISILIIIAAALAIIAFVVLLQVGERRIPVQYAKRMQGRKMLGGQSTHIPLKVNTAGVIPVIFASSLMQTPTIITRFVTKEATGIWATILKYLNYYDVKSNYGTGAILYSLLIILFAYFYTSITFNPLEVANNMKKNGGFIPGIRPGKPTVEYLTKVVNHIVLIGAVGLTLATVVPTIVLSLKGLQLSVLGTSIIIVVGVALETVKQIESQMLMRHYKGFLNS